MANRTIGIDFDDHRMFAVQVAGDSGGYRIERACQLNITTDRPISDVLQRLIAEQGFDRRATVSVVVPERRVFVHRRQAVSISDRTERNITVSESDFPLPIESLVIDTVNYRDPMDQHEGVHEIGVSRDYLEQLFGSIERAGFRCEMADVSAFAFCAAVCVNHPVVIKESALCIYCDETRMVSAVLQNGEVIMSRHMAGDMGHCFNNAEEASRVDALLREIEMTWRAAFGEQIPEATQVVMAGNEKSYDDLIPVLKEQFGCRVIQYDPYAHVTVKSNEPLGSEFSIALGAALRGVSPEQFKGANFSQVRSQHRRNRQGLKREMTVFSGLAIAILVLWAGWVWMHKARLEDQYAKVNGEIRRVFLQTLPDEKNIVDELGQLEVELAAKRQEVDHYGVLTGSAGATPLDVLSVLSTGSSKAGKIVIEETAITERLATINATSASFESVYQWQKALEASGMFSSVKVGDVRKQTDGQGVRFSMTLSLVKEDR